MKKSLFLLLISVLFFSFANAQQTAKRLSSTNVDPKAKCITQKAEGVSLKNNGTRTDATLLEAKRITTPKNVMAPITQFPWSEGFEEGTFPPEGWTLKDNDGDGIDWGLQLVLSDQITFSDIEGYNSAHAVGSASYRNDVGALSPDNWLITPALQIPTGNYDLKYWVGAIDSDFYYDHYEVMVSTTGTDISDFTSIFEETLTTAEWQQRSISLGSYSGQTIHIAFVHNESNDVYIIRIDDISVVAGATSPELEVVSVLFDAPANYFPLHHAANILPGATIKNNGIAMTTSATLNIGITPGAYSQTLTISSLGAGASNSFMVAAGNGFTPTATGEYTITASTNFSDSNPDNNMASTKFSTTDNFFAMDNGISAGGVGANGGTIIFGNLFKLTRADVISSFLISFNDISSSEFNLMIFSLDDALTTATKIYESENFNRDAATDIATLTEFPIDPQSLQAGDYLFCINQFNAVNIACSYDATANGEFYQVNSDGSLVPYINSSFGNVMLRVKVSQATATTPVNNAKEVEIDAPVTVTFMENMTAATLSNISITPNPGGVSASINGNVLSINHNDFAYNTSYTVNVPTSAITGLLSPVSWSFKTKLDPTACNTPENLNVVPDIYSAAISWDEKGAGQTWDIKYGDPGFDVETAGTLVSAITYDQGKEYYTLAGLNAATKYDVYVRSNCGPGEHSEWGGPSNFRTLPDCSIAIDDFPWEEGFEAAIIDCWEVYSLTENGSNWGVNTNTSYVKEGAQSIFHNYNGNIDEDAWIVSPIISVPATGNYALRFWSYNRFASDYVKNSVLVSTGSGDPEDNDFVEIWTTESVQDDWVETTLLLTDYLGEDIQIAFRYQGLNAHSWYVDEISIFDFNLVDAAVTKIISPVGGVNMTSTETVKAIIENKGSESISNFTLTLTVDGTAIATETFTETIASLSQVEYEFEKEADLSADGNHTVSVTVNLTGDEVADNNTIEAIIKNVVCVTITEFPWEPDFSDGITPCWVNIDADGDGFDWFAAPLEENGPYYLVSESYYIIIPGLWEGPLTPDNYLISPLLQLDDQSSYKLTFEVGAVDPNDYAENYEILVSTTGTDPEDFTPIHTETLTGAALKEVEISLDDYAGQSIYIAFRHYDCTGQYMLLIGSVKVDASEVSIPDVKKGNNIQLFPNPAKEEVKLSNLSGNAVVTLCDLTGRNIVSYKANNELNIPVANLEKGIYLVKIEIGNQSVIKKLIIE